MTLVERVREEREAIATTVPRLRCSGTAWEHEEVFLTIRTAYPLVMQCPICEAIERPNSDAGRDR